MSEEVNNILKYSLGEKSVNILLILLIVYTDIDTFVGYMDVIIFHKSHQHKRSVNILRMINHYLHTADLITV